MRPARHSVVYIEGRVENPSQNQATGPLHTRDWHEAAEPAFARIILFGFQCIANAFDVRTHTYFKQGILSFLFLTLCHLGNLRLPPPPVIFIL